MNLFSVYLVDLLMGNTPLSSPIPFMLNSGIEVRRYGYRIGNIPYS